MGWLQVGNNPVTIDTVGGTLAFDDSSGRTWGTGAVVIENFAPGAVSFGTDASGLTAGQLSQITAYDSGGGLVSGLSLDSSGSLIPEPSTIGLFALSGLGLFIRRSLRK